MSRRFYVLAADGKLLWVEKPCANQPCGVIRLFKNIEDASLYREAILDDHPVLSRQLQVVRTDEEKVLQAVPSINRTHVLKFRAPVQIEIDCIQEGGWLQEVELLWVAPELRH